MWDTFLGFLQITEELCRVHLLFCTVTSGRDSKTWAPRDSINRAPNSSVIISEVIRRFYERDQEYYLLSEERNPVQKNTQQSSIFSSLALT
jgi:hypothetical protein